MIQLHLYCHCHIEQATFNLCRCINNQNCFKVMVWANKKTNNLEKVTVTQTKPTSTKNVDGKTALMHCVSNQKVFEKLKLKT